MKKSLLFLILSISICFNSFSAIGITVRIEDGNQGLGFYPSMLQLAPGDYVIFENYTNADFNLKIHGETSAWPSSSGSRSIYTVPQGFSRIDITLLANPSPFYSYNNIPLKITDSVTYYRDSDLDRVRDIMEEEAGTDPYNKDSDSDGIEDAIELGIPAFDADLLETTDPLKADTDGGGLTDGQEDLNGNGRVDDGENNPNNVKDDVVTSLEMTNVPLNQPFLYPQPASDKLYVRYRGAYTVSDLLGTKVKNGVLTSDELDISKLQPGIYFFTFNKESYRFTVNR